MAITLNGAGTGAFTDASGNVGIGVATSSYPLTVRSTGTSTTVGANIGARLESNGSGYAVTLQFSDNVANSSSISMVSSATAFLQAGTEAMRITSAGNVGIGTNSPTAMLQISGSSSTEALKVPNISEPATVSATAATGTINYDVTTQSVLYYTSNASANWTVNFRGSSGTSLNTIMAVNDVMTVAFFVTQGATPYYNNAVTVDGSSVTPKYQGGTAWTAGNASGIDVYTYTIIKTASATFTVLAAQTQFICLLHLPVARHPLWLLAGLGSLRYLIHTSNM
jgi:hypothetical protein